MSEKPTMTLDEALKLRRKWRIAFVVICITPVALLFYAMIHPARHKVLLLIIGTMVVPMVAAIALHKTGKAGLLRAGVGAPATNAKTLLKNHPTLILTLPIIIIALMWGVLLASLKVESVDGHKAWLSTRTNLALFWFMTPVIVLEYLCVHLHSPFIGAYLAACVVYATAQASIYGLRLEGGVVAFFGTYKAQASPLVILTMALFCCLSFGALHYALWTVMPTEYVNLNGISDAIYFSVVTMATVGYGDILPVGHLARWLCVAEIVSGVLLLIVGVSASMTVWIQTNQPKTAEGVTAKLEGISQPLSNREDDSSESASAGQSPLASDIKV